MNLPLRLVTCAALLCWGQPLAAQSAGDDSPAPSDASPVVTQPAAPPGDNTLRLEVIDPYAELRTGPGRGYPVFYALERGETIELLTRRPGWYEVRAGNGQTGWTSTGELARTMQGTGEPADLPSVSHGDYLQSDWRVGLRAGRFSSGELDNADTFSATVGYKLLSWLGLEAEWGKMFDDDVRARYYSFNALVEPFSQWRLSPFLSAGLGEMDIESQPKQVPLAIDSSDFESYSAGGNYYIGRNFVVQASYRLFVVDAEDDTERLESWSIGFSAFF